MSESQLFFYVWLFFYIRTAYASTLTVKNQSFVPSSSMGSRPGLKKPETNNSPTQPLPMSRTPQPIRVHLSTSPPLTKPQNTIKVVTGRQASFRRPEPVSNPLESLVENSDSPNSPVRSLPPIKKEKNSEEEKQDSSSFSKVVIEETKARQDLTTPPTVIEDDDFLTAMSTPERKLSAATTDKTDFSAASSVRTTPSQSTSNPTGDEVRGRHSSSEVKKTDDISEQKVDMSEQKAKIEKKAVQENKAEIKKKPSKERGHWKLVAHYESLEFHALALGPNYIVYHRHGMPHPMILEHNIQQGMQISLRPRKTFLHLDPHEHVLSISVAEEKAGQPACSITCLQISNNNVLKEDQDLSVITYMTPNVFYVEQNYCPHCIDNSRFKDSLKNKCLTRCRQRIDKVIWRRLNSFRGQHDFSLVSLDGSKFMHHVQAQTDCLVLADRVFLGADQVDSLQGSHKAGLAMGKKLSKKLLVPVLTILIVGLWSDFARAALRHGRFNTDVFIVSSVFSMFLFLVLCKRLFASDSDNSEDAVRFSKFLLPNMAISTGYKVLQKSNPAGQQWLDGEFGNQDWTSGRLAYNDNDTLSRLKIEREAEKQVQQQLESKRLKVLYNLDSTKEGQLLKKSKNGAWRSFDEWRPEHELKKKQETKVDLGNETVLTGLLPSASNSSSAATTIQSSSSSTNSFAATASLPETKTNIASFLSITNPLLASIAQRQRELDQELRMQQAFDHKTNMSTAQTLFYSSAVDGLPPLLRLNSTARASPAVSETTKGAEPTSGDDQKHKVNLSEQATPPISSSKELFPATKPGQPATLIASDEVKAESVPVTPRTSVGSLSISGDNSVLYSGRRGTLSSKSTNSTARRSKTTPAPIQKSQREPPASNLTRGSQPQRSQTPTQVRLTPSRGDRELMRSATPEHGSLKTRSLGDNQNTPGKDGRKRRKSVPALQHSSLAKSREKIQLQSTITDEFKHLHFVKEVPQNHPEYKTNQNSNQNDTYEDLFTDWDYVHNDNAGRQAAAIDAADKEMFERSGTFGGTFDLRRSMSKSPAFITIHSSPPTASKIETKSREANDLQGDNFRFSIGSSGSAGREEFLRPPAISLTNNDNDGSGSRGDGDRSTEGGEMDHLQVDVLQDENDDEEQEMNENDVELVGENMRFIDISKDKPMPSREDLLAAIGDDDMIIRYESQQGKFSPHRRSTISSNISRSSVSSNHMLLMTKKQKENFVREYLKEQNLSPDLDEAKVEEPASHMPFVIEIAEMPKDKKENKQSSFIQRLPSIFASLTKPRKRKQTNPNDDDAANGSIEIGMRRRSSPTTKNNKDPEHKLGGKRRKERIGYETRQSGIAISKYIDVETADQMTAIRGVHLADNPLASSARLHQRRMLHEWAEIDGDGTVDGGKCISHVDGFRKTRGGLWESDEALLQYLTATKRRRHFKNKQKVDLLKGSPVSFGDSSNNAGQVEHKYKRVASMGSVHSGPSHVSMEEMSSALFESKGGVDGGEGGRLSMDGSNRAITFHKGHQPPSLNKALSTPSVMQLQHPPQIVKSLSTSAIPRITEKKSRRKSGTFVNLTSFGKGMPWDKPFAHRMDTIPEATASQSLIPAKTALGLFDQLTRTNSFSKGVDYKETIGKEQRRKELAELGRRKGGVVFQMNRKGDQVAIARYRMPGNAASKHIRTLSDNDEVDSVPKRTTVRERTWDLKIYQWILDDNQ